MSGKRKSAVQSKKGGEKMGALKGGSGNLDFRLGGG